MGASRGRVSAPGADAGRLIMLPGAPGRLVSAGTAAVTADEQQRLKTYRRSHRPTARVVQGMLSPYRDGAMPQVPESGPPTSGAAGSAGGLDARGGGASGSRCGGGVWSATTDGVERCTSSEPFPAAFLADEAHEVVPPHCDELPADDAAGYGTPSEVLSIRQAPVAAQEVNSTIAPVRPSRPQTEGDSDSDLMPRSGRTKA